MQAYTTLWSREPQSWEVDQIKKNEWETVSSDPNEGGGNREVGAGGKSKWPLSFLQVS